MKMIRQLGILLLLWLSAFVVAIIFSSCATKTPFTSELKSEFNLDEKAMKKIQFYTSEEIVLAQSEGKSYLQTKDGVILLSDVKNKNVITIKKNTPCVVEGIFNSGIVKVSFESDTNRVLLFGVNNIGLYSLSATEWNGQIGTIKYGGLTYATCGNSGSSCLMVKLKKLNKVSGRSKTLSGKRL